MLYLNGIYKHYKGNYYKVLHIAKHSETLEPLVVYQALYGEKGIWVRPLPMFLEKVGEQERFQYMEGGTPVETE